MFKRSKRPDLHQAAKKTVKPEAAKSRKENICCISFRLLGFYVGRAKGIAAEGGRGLVFLAAESKETAAGTSASGLSKCLGEKFWLPSGDLSVYSNQRFINIRGILTCRKPCA